MAIRSGFFNSVNGDRRYDAKRFAEYFAAFIGSGIFPNPSNNLQVIANNDMTVTVKAGNAWINGYILINDNEYILNITPADGVLNRIDRIVARYDVVDREIRLEVKQGDYATDAVAKDLQRDADAYELALADIQVNKGIISITQANITDLRLNGELCGIVHGTVDQVDTTTLFNQYQDWYLTNTTQAETDIDNIKQQFQNDLIQFNSDWNNWFSQQQTEGFVLQNEKGQVNGVPTLDSTGNIPLEQLGNISLTPEDIGAETPSGAQAKVDDLAGVGRTTETVKGAYDKAEQAFQSASDGKQKIATAITGKGVPTGSSDTFANMANNIDSIVTDPSGDATAEASHILYGVTAYSKYRKLVGTMANHGSKTFTPSDSVQTGAAGYYSSIKINPRPALSGTADEAHVFAGKYFYKNSYSRKLGTMPNRGAPAITLTSQGGQHNLASGYYGGGYIKAQLPNLIAGNVRKGVNIGGVVGSFDGYYATGSKDAPENHMTVRGLSFKPKIVYAVSDDVRFTIYLLNTTYIGSLSSVSLDSRTIIYNDGFYIPIPIRNKVYTWHAFG